MKKVVSVTEVSGEGLESLLSEKVILLCMNYIYTGILEGVNTSCVLLKDAKIVFETGAFSDKNFKDAQSVGEYFYIQTNSIESFGKTNKS